VSAEQWGRVDPDGTVWVRTEAGERAVGSYPGASEADALAYFVRKFDDLQAQVGLLQQRIAAGHLSGSAAMAAIAKLTTAVTDANAVGDLAGLLRRLQELEPLVQARTEQVSAQRAAARAQALAARTALVEEAEALASVDAERLPWKSTGDRLRELFDTWRTMQRDNRLDKHTEDELWRRFSHARTMFDRKRRQHFGALDEQRAAARGVKDQIVAEAEALASSTDWAAGATGFRDLMARWRAAGRAGRRDEETLWARFRAAQDAFFAGRNAAADEADAELRGHLEVKEAILAEAEALLPVTDLHAARSALRTLQERWDAAGKVPRADVSRIEGRLRAVEQVIRDAEQTRWTRSNPEARARAQDAVDQLEHTIGGLQAARDKAAAGGNAKGVADAEAAIAAREEWLTRARAALAEFGG
jgi:hypothetical protein